jgi:acyl-CoA synthetase
VDETLTDVVRAHARTKPDADAFVTPDARCSWREYRDRSAALAGVYVASGYEPGVRVGVLLPDGAPVHIAFLAGEQAGVTTVGIGARAGEREIAHLVERTGAVALVTHETYRAAPAAEVVDRLRTVVARDLDHVVVDEHGGARCERGARPLTEPEIDARRVGPDDAFLLNSTSGTTGLPKCVIQTQRRWRYFHGLAVEAGALHVGDVFLSAIPAPFGFGLWTAHFTPTLLGAPVALVPRFSPEVALELVEREHVTVMACVSTQFVMMLESPAMARADLTSLRVLFTGGEAVPEARAAAFEDATGARVLQFYGSNETGALSRTTVTDDRQHRLTTAGRVIADMHVRVLDDDGHDVPSGVPGVPCCRGPATSPGYFDDAAANAELFTPDGWMRMGDIATLDRDGWLRVVGRASDFVIRGGKNISAKVVEDEVTSHPAVALAAAVAMPDPVFGERVCVFVELRPGTSLTLDALVAHLRSRGTSPETFPERLELLDHLPRASGGKLAKGELRERARTLAELDSSDQ